MYVISTERIPIKIWATGLEESALEQAKEICKLPFVKKWAALMPDAHLGYGMPIGGVVCTDGVVVLNMVGVDIGCGVQAARTDIEHIDLTKLKSIMDEVKKSVPVGFNHHKEKQDWLGFNNAPNNKVILDQLQSAQYQIGTLGGGNHFIEFQEDEEGFLWIMVHSGSRNLGYKVAKHYNKVAQELCEKWCSNIPNRDLAFLPMDSDIGQEYFAAMNYCVEFARANRDEIICNILCCIRNYINFGVHFKHDVPHNYAAYENHYGKNVIVHRKGATRAREGDTGIIPGSMGTASYIVEGLGNPESFYSCSHGAGRRMGRKEAQRGLNLEEEIAKMDGILHGIKDSSNLDEAPGSYKDIDEVMDNQKDLVKIATKLRPIGSIKG